MSILRINEIYNGSSPEQMLQSSQHKLLVVIKNSVKYKGKLINGVRCSQCAKGLHWRLGGGGGGRAKRRSEGRNHNSELLELRLLSNG